MKTRHTRSRTQRRTYAAFPRASSFSVSRLALGVGVLAVLCGVLAMHALTAGHSAATVLATGDEVAHHTTAHPISGPASSPTEMVGSCSGDCVPSHQAGVICLAVLGALGLLLLRRGSARPVRLERTSRLASLRLLQHVTRPPPSSLVALCISRT